MFDIQFEKLICYKITKFCMAFVKLRMKTEINPRFDPKEMIVWNIKGLRHQVGKMNGLKA